MTDLQEYLAAMRALSATQGGSPIITGPNSAGANGDAVAYLPHMMFESNIEVPKLLITEFEKVTKLKYTDPSREVYLDGTGNYHYV